MKPIKKQDYGPESNKEGELYREVMDSKPKFASSAEALAVYRAELSQIAACENKKVEDLVVLVDDGSTWTDQSQRVNTLAMIISTLSRGDVPNTR